jgi:hypothetical protein
MIHFVWVIIRDTPVAGMRFIKITDEQERERLEKFYGWLSGPISEFTTRVQDIILEETKFYYHARNDVLFVVGSDLDETSVSTILIPEIQDKFFQTFSADTVNRFDGGDITQFRVFNSVLGELVTEFDQRKVEAEGDRKALDAFEVLNLPNEFQMVALVLVKMQVITPEMASQSTGLATAEVEKQLQEIYNKGYLYKTTISNRIYYSIKPFGTDDQIKLTPSTTKPAFQFDTTTQTPAPPKPGEVPTSQTTIPSSPAVSSADKIQPQLEQITDIPPKKEPKRMKLKVDPIAQEIDKSHRLILTVPKNGFLSQNSLRREKGFVSGKIRLPSEKNRDPLLLNSLFRKDLENIYEALFMGDMIVVTSNQPTIFEDALVDNLLTIMDLLTPHRKLTITKSYTFVHPKDADVVVVPKDIVKFYSWATIIDLDTSKIIGGKSTEYTRNLTKKLRKITEPKEFLLEVTAACSVLIKIGRDINTLKIEGRSPDLYLTEVKKAFGVAILDAGLALSERLIRSHKDCAYIAGFYIRKGLDVAVRAIIINDPLVIIGDDPLDVYHIIEALTIFAPSNEIKAQVWTTNFADISLDEYMIMGAQEGTDKLFKNAVKVNIRSMSAYGGSRSKYLHEFLRKMWHHRSNERPKFIRDQIALMMSNIKNILQKLTAFGENEPTKQEIRDILSEYDPNFGEFIVDFLNNLDQDIATKIRSAL